MIIRVQNWEIPSLKFVFTIGVPVKDYSRTALCPLN